MPRHGDGWQEALAAGVGLAFESRERDRSGLFSERQHEIACGHSLRLLGWTAELCAFVFEDRDRVDERDQFLHEGGIGDDRWARADVACGWEGVGDQIGRASCRERE